MIGDASDRDARFIGRGVLAVSVLCGPGLWILAFWFAYQAWRPGVPSLVFFSGGYLTFLFCWWALWGVIAGPTRLRPWWFALASVLNAIAGVRIGLGQSSPERWIGLFFIAYSVWQFFVFRRKP